MAKKELLEKASDQVGGGATGAGHSADPVGGTATLPNSKKQGDFTADKVQNNGGPSIEDTDPANNTKPTGDKSAANKATIATKPSAASSTVKEDVAAMLDGFELSEDFKDQATTLFEAAVSARVAEERTSLEEQFQAKQAELEESFEAAKAELVEEVSERVDDYLSYVVNEWMQENQVAIEQSLRTELTEELIGNIKRVFEESHINLPDEEVSVVEELAAHVEELEAKLNATIDENIALSSALEESVRADVFEQVAEGLAMTQVEKFRTLAEGVTFDDAETYADKLQIVKEQYFGEKKASAPAQLIEERELVDLNEEVAAPAVKPEGAVASYMTAISRTVKK